MLVLKLLLTPLLVVAASAVQRRWGPGLGGLIVGLPLTAGPVTLFVALDQGVAFAARAAAATLWGVVSLTGFCWAYSFAALRRGWPASALAGLAAYFVLALALQAVRPPFGVSVALVVVAIGTAYRRVPRPRTESSVRRAPAWDLPARAAAATAMVLTLTAIAEIVGPQWTGLLAPFPVFAGVLAVFTHATQGRSEATALLRGVLAGSFTYVLFFVVLSSSLQRFGVGPSFVAAIFLCVAFHAAIVRPAQRWLAGRSH